MTKKVGRNDPCPCGSGKKYKQCCLLKEKEGGAKFAPSGKRKFKATHIKTSDKSMSVFNRSATQPQPTASPDALQRLKFRMAKEDFRKKGEEVKLPFEISPSKEKPQQAEKQELKPDEPFKPTETDFRKSEGS
ncbi:MAG: SEC-C metal-binding domain-containing protein [Chlamydiales bacterium]